MLAELEKVTAKELAIYKKVFTQSIKRGDSLDDAAQIAKMHIVLYRGFEKGFGEFELLKDYDEKFLFLNPAKINGHGAAKIIDKVMMFFAYMTMTKVQRAMQSKITETIEKAKKNGEAPSISQLMESAFAAAGMEVEAIEIEDDSDDSDTDDEPGDMMPGETYDQYIDRKLKEKNKR